MGTGDLEDGPAVDGRLIHFFSVAGEPQAAGVPAVGIGAAMHFDCELYLWPGLVEPPAPGWVKPVLGDIGRQACQMELGIGLQLGHLLTDRAFGLSLRRRLAVGAMLGLDESFQFDGR